MVLRFDFSQLVLADDIQGLEKNFNDLLCPVLKEYWHSDFCRALYDAFAQ